MNKVEVIARGVCIKNNQLLLCRTMDDSNTYLPGGHVDFDESARDALSREIMEEMGKKSSVGRFLGAVEHAFMQKGERHCEINLVFLLDVKDVDVDKDPEACESHLSFLWHDIDDIENSALEPATLRPVLGAWLNSDTDNLISF